MAEAKATPATRIDVACPGCGSDQRRLELVGTDPLTLHAFDVVRCAACRLVYVHPRPTDECLAIYYPQDYFAERHPFFKRQIMTLRARKLGRPQPGARLLDVGCGSGDFMLACKRRGWEVVGTEQASSPIMARAAGLGIRVVTLGDLAHEADASFDAVTFWHVFEHLTEPRATLQEIHRLLKPGGRLLIEVPNFGSWQARMTRARWYHLEVPRHLSHFERETLAAMVAAEGLVPERWRTFSLEYDAFGLLQGMLNKLCRTPNHLYQVLIGEPTRRDLRDSIVSLGLALPLGVFALAVSLLAAACGNGGVLRMTARRRDV